MTERLIEAAYGVHPEAPRQRRARHRDNVTDPVESEPRRHRKGRRLDAERREGKRCDRIARPPLGHNHDIVRSIPRDRMRRTWRVGDADAGGEAGSPAERHQPPGKALLATVEMRRTGQVDPQTIRPRHCREWCPPGYGMQRQPVQQSAIGVMVGGADVNVGDERARLRRRHADDQPEAQRRRTGRDHDLAAADLVDQDQRRRVRDGAGTLALHRRVTGCAEDIVGPLAPERMLGRLRTPTEFAQGGAPVRRHGLDAALDVVSRPTLPRPPGARTPSTAPRHRTGTGVIIDRREQDRQPLRRRALRPLYPTQALDRQLRQKERGDPCHRTPPE
jgi:hypothetical protein